MQPLPKEHRLTGHVEPEAHHFIHVDGALVRVILEVLEVDVWDFAFHGTVWVVTAISLEALAKAG
jgi:hypothetical protein